MHTRWTPDGNGLVFQEDFASRADIWVLDLEGDDIVATNYGKVRMGVPFFDPRLWPFPPDKTSD